MEEGKEAKVTLPLYVIKQHDMKTYESWRVQSQPYLTWTFEGGELSVSSHRHSPFAAVSITWETRYISESVLNCMKKRILLSCRESKTDYS
jgi:hypothetical protein